MCLDWKYIWICIMKRTCKHWEVFVLSVCSLFVWLLQASASAAAKQRTHRHRSHFPLSLLVGVQHFQSTNEEPLAMGTRAHAHKFPEESRSLYTGAASFDRLLFSIDINFVPFEPSFGVAMILFFMKSFWTKTKLHKYQLHERQGATSF